MIPMREGTHRCQWIIRRGKVRVTTRQCGARTRKRQHGLWLCAMHERMHNPDQQRIPA